MSEELSLRELRLQKLARMRELGHDPYAIEKFERTDSAQGLLENFEENKQVAFAGRVVSYRLMGKAGFAHLSDGDGKIQIYCRKDDVGEVGWELYHLLDIGDHVGVKGYLFVTKTGEKSIHVSELIPLSKSLQVLPLGKTQEVKDDEGNVIGTKTWYELEDVEQRYRHRHLDLIVNPDARKALINRARIVSAVRRYFDQNGYLEVETPLLQVVAGGAAARPFKTHYNAYDLEVKLRISLELYLKRLICGDIPAVYEIGRVFRNEGVSNRHNPEFTLLEFYESYTNLEGMMRRVEELFAFVAIEVYGSAHVQLGHEDEPCSEFTYDFSKPWKRVSLLEEIERHTDLTAEELSDLELAKKAMVAKSVVDKAHEVGGHISLEKEDNLGGLIEKLLEVFVEPTLQEPTFVVGYPIETSPLAKKEPGNPRMTRRFEGYVLGREICNAFSEINDPVDQKERFEQQGKELAKGDEEAHPYDEEFLYALEGGMPPTGGCGIGMERLAMILTGADHIREVMFFPMMKPKEE
ncbi:MAG: lysine--tRNA ligase [Fimbriimonadaceae bacterium]|nr:lysine--tRNA ligase [Fimbriimonadaceae bacterium]